MFFFINSSIAWYSYINDGHFIISFYYCNVYCVSNSIEISILRASLAVMRDAYIPS